jgi:hypothetical protein
MDKHKTSEQSRLLARYLKDNFEECVDIEELYQLPSIDTHALAKVIDNFYDELNKHG